MNSITVSATAPRGGIALCVALLAVLAGTLAPAAEAYVGPGAGFALVGSLLAVLSALLAGAPSLPAADSELARRAVFLCPRMLICAPFTQRCDP